MKSSSSSNRCRYCTRAVSPFLQISQTLPCLDKLAQYHLLADDEARQLGAAYRFLRDVEHRLQMENNLQTHTLPAEPAARGCGWRG